MALPSFSAATRNLPELDEAARGVGAITVSPLDTHGVIRQLPLLWNGGARIYPSLVLETLRVMQQGIDAARSQPRRGAVRGHERARRSLTTFPPPRRAKCACGSAVRSRDAGRVGRRALLSERGRCRICVRSSPAMRFSSGPRPPGSTTTRDAAGRQRPRGAGAGPGARADPCGRTSARVPIGRTRSNGHGCSRSQDLTTLVAVLCAPMTALCYGGAMAALTCLGAWIAFSRGGVLLDPTSSCATGPVSLRGDDLVPLLRVRPRPAVRAPGVFALRRALLSGADREESREPPAGRGRAADDDPVRRHPQLHGVEREAVADRGGRVPQHPVRAPEHGHSRRGRHHRQIYRRFHHGVLERAAADAGSCRARLPGGFADARDLARTQRNRRVSLPPATPIRSPTWRSESASMWGRRSSAIWARKAASTIRSWAMR